MIEAKGTFRLSDQGRRRTSGQFSKIMANSGPTFERYFGREMYDGSLNLNVEDPPDLMEAIRRAGLAPEIVIPREEIAVPGRPSRIGEHRFWAMRFASGKIPSDVPCWLMRKVGTGLAKDHHEVLSGVGLRSAYGLRHGDPFTLIVAGD